MNELLDDEVIARLRSALDEMTADSHGLVAADAPRPTVSAARWMAVAAAVVLVIGAVTAIAINRGNAPDVATVPTELSTTTPTEPTLIRVETPWFRLAAADLLPSERVHEQCCQEPEVNLAWSNGNAYLMLAAYSKPGTTSVDPVGPATQLETDSAILTFRSFGLTDDERAALADKVVPGSGLPYVLPVDGWNLIALGQAPTNAGLVQAYTPLNNDPLSSYLPTVEMRVGGYRGELSLLGAFPDPQPITVAGYDGWKVTEDDGTVSALWDVGDGYWATLRIDAKLADRADALIIGVVQVTEEAANEPTVDTVLAPTESASELTIAGDALPAYDGSVVPDPAVGMPAPAAYGFDYEGNEIHIDPAEGPQLVMFEAHWCPHCAASLPDVMKLMEDGTIPSWLPITVVSTAELSTADNYPADKWLQELGWTGRVLRDSNEGDGAAGRAGMAYGGSGWPYFVVIGVDGNVLARASGELTKADMESLMSGLPNGPADVVGRLEIPKIDVDWFVVDNTLGLEVSAQSGPVFVGGALPTELPIDTDMDVYSMIYGNRTTHGAPFLDLDQLIVGDTFTWTDETGTASFEVISTNTCPADEGCPGIAGALVLTTPDPKFTNKTALYVFARRTA